MKTNYDEISLSHQQQQQQQQTATNNNNICINNGYKKHIYAYSKTSDEAACDDRSPLFLVEDNSGATAGVWGN